MRVEHRRGSPVAMHALDLDGDGGASAWFLEPEWPALVLGSTQPDADVDEDAAAAIGVDVGRRRSGGGAVLLWPGGQVWLDVVIFRDDPRWHAQVDVATHWIGALWAEVLRSVGVADATLHTAGHLPGDLGAVACFAGIGPGEVISGGKKVVGISQRRTSRWARFQTAAYVTGDRDAPAPTDVARIVAPGAARLGRSPGEVAAALQPAPLPVSRAVLLAALEAAIVATGD